MFETKITHTYIEVILAQNTVIYNYKLAKHLVNALHRMYTVYIMQDASVGKRQIDMYHDL